MTPARRKALRSFDANGRFRTEYMGTCRWQVIPSTMDSLEKDGLAIRSPSNAIAWDADWYLTTKGLRLRATL